MPDPAMYMQHDNQNEFAHAKMRNMNAGVKVDNLYKQFKDIQRKHRQANSTED